MLLGLVVPRVNVARAVLSGLLLMASQSHAAQGDLDFSRDIRPILSANCFACHGPDTESRKAGLRLDTLEGATKANDKHDAVILPGNAAASEFVQRILTDDPDDVMPPPSSGRVLQPDDIARLQTWISQGANYAVHWSFERPIAQPLPEVKDTAWPRSGLDYYVLAGIEGAGLQPSPEADPYTLVRRLHLDLIGLPPDPAVADAFAANPTETAYADLVDDLLASPRYGERWARVWLDLARYADTKGYEKDDARIIWRYRDWVINAFNADRPYDQFTMSQLAGDLLPEPTTEDLIATAFHRNTMTNDEGGTDDEEFRVAAIIDRVNSTMEVWMGLTMGCAQCHNHKYDPISMKEYYQVFDVFNQTEDADAFPIENPVIPTPTEDQVSEQARLARAVALARETLTEKAVALQDDQRAWEDGLLAKGDLDITLGSWYHAGPFAAENFDGAFATRFGPESGVKLSDTYENDAVRWRKKPDWVDGERVAFEEGDVSVNYAFRKITSPIDQEVPVFVGSNDGIKIWANGEVVHNNRVLRAGAARQDTVKVPLATGENELLFKIVNSGGAHDFFFEMDTRTLPEEVVTALKTTRGDRTEAQEKALRGYYAEQAPAFEAERQQLQQLEKEQEDLAAAIPTTPILRELPQDNRRTTHIFAKGSFLNPGEIVTAGVPERFNAFPEEAPLNRLGFAQWLTHRDNPLTARVAANRYWQAFFGIGIVQTAEDFGTQGELPSNQALLDWLAVEFMDKGWSMKELCRTIVLSSTYRQSSTVTDLLRERDPYNQLLARGPRFRLEAEVVRDQALASSGLLSAKMFGPSVMPPQPEGVWNSPYGSQNWTTSAGEDQHRRGLYTFYKRTAGYPSMLTFDAPTREVCASRRIRTNTPLQAMIVLNDPVYVEAAQALARRMWEEGGDGPEARAALGFRLCVTREPEPEELATLVSLYQGEAAHYRKHENAAKALLEEYAEQLPEGASAAELASWTVVSNVLLNLDETLTKR